MLRVAAMALTFLLVLIKFVTAMSYNFVPFVVGLEQQGPSFNSAHNLGG